MAFESIENFLLMGTHGVYVWSSYGIFVISMLILFIQSVRSRTKQKMRILRRMRSLDKTQLSSALSDQNHAP
ncbi:heme exporter protein D [Marinomonas balearica]|uniref:Heme exporter protein D n=2 Tax=Marinomonas balearica TaxID=491947 RepID=A0A4R6MA47_9GAMM|nr:heme exporter protein D [Marinomonas balearica]